VTKVLFQVIIYYWKTDVNSKENVMQIKRTYQNVNPELLYDEIKDLVVKQGTVAAEAKLETYLLPEDSSSFVTRATLSFHMKDGQEDKECLRVQIVGSVRGETRVLLDIDEKLFPPERLSALESDLDFIFSPYEAEA
jgi:hypothetical protein